MLGKIIEHNLKITDDQTIRDKLVVFDEDMSARAEDRSEVTEANTLRGFQGNFV